MSRRTPPSRNPFALRLHTPVGAARRLAFWVSVVLPVVYLPMLAVGYQQLPALAGLVALNVICLVLGHDYSP